MHRCRPECQVKPHAKRRLKPLILLGFFELYSCQKNNNFMKKTDFDICHRPSFLILAFFDALYTPIWGALMYV